jgi:hypothetical protein
MSAIRATSLSVAAFFAIAFATAACGPSADPDGEVRGTGLALTFDVLANTDVGGFSFTATEVNCATGAAVIPANVVNVTEDLEDMFFPGTGGAFEDAPFDGGSQHIFSDHFFTLSVGCYDVTVQPVTDAGSDSSDCASASQSGVEVLDGATTEIVLISQCVGDPSTGGLDVVAAINHPPVIDYLSYNPSKFICGDRTTICVSAHDVDDDPVTIVASGEGFTVAIPLDDASTRADCFIITLPAPGVYDVTFTAYDMAYDASGALVTIEDLLALQGDALPSHDTFTAPVHVLPASECITACDCPDGFEPTADESSCISIENVSPLVFAEEWRICPIRPSTAYGWGGGFFPDGGRDTVTPFYQDRLNEVGIWGCWPDSALDDGFASSRPFNEWVGFNVCMNVPETGNYVLGVGGDDRVRFSVNGTELFNQSNGHIFTRWWLRPIVLTAGSNIVEIEGYNNTDIGAFGAEIYGPFSAADVASDTSLATLNYAGNTIWSTADITGTFPIGEQSGMSCPEDFEMSTCGREVTCTRIRRALCRE